MARLARVVVSGHPHHVTQRGNGRQRTFFGDDDYRFYRDLLAEHCQATDGAVWAYCLMPNHAHLILVPTDEDGIRRALAPLHRRYAGAIHARLRRTGHFWQGRFGCVAMDEPHCLAAIRYVLMNPVRAGLVARAADWPWSSARTLLGLADDGVTSAGPVAERCPELAAMLESAEDEEMTRRLRRAESVGRPIGSAEWLKAIEAERGRSLAPGKPSPRRRQLSALSP